MIGTKDSLDTLIAQQVVESNNQTIGLHRAANKVASLSLSQEIGIRLRNELYFCARKCKVNAGSSTKEAFTAMRLRNLIVLFASVSHFS